MCTARLMCSGSACCRPSDDGLMSHQIHVLGVCVCLAATFNAEDILAAVASSCHLCGCLVGYINALGSSLFVSAKCWCAMCASAPYLFFVGWPSDHFSAAHGQTSSAVPVRPCDCAAPALSPMSQVWQFRGHPFVEAVIEGCKGCPHKGCYWGQ
jgi:hypothetical protein